MPPAILSEISEREILSCLPNGLIVLNTEGQVIWMNDAAKHILGADLTAKTWRTLIQELFSPKDDDGLEVSLVNGRRVHVAISSLETLPGELVVLTDFTATRDYEQARENQKQLLSLGRMTAQLAHQIRTPLASAILYTEHLSTAAIKDERSRQWLARIQDCHSSIEQQIEDLLLFVRGERLEKKTINLRHWGELLEERIRSLLERENIHVHLVNTLPSKPFNIHEEALAGAVLNLLNNSIQAEAKELEIIMAEEEQEGFYVSVRDNGKGMSAEIKEQALAPFFTTRAQGTGLGLAVVHAIIKAHEGTISLQSSPGQGCYIQLRIPAKV